MLKALEEIALQHRFRLRIGVKADSFRQAFELLCGGGVSTAICHTISPKAFQPKQYAIAAFDRSLRLTRQIAIACDKRAADVRPLLCKTVDSRPDVVASSRAN